jgi:hypothetical protein
MASEKWEELYYRTVFETDPRKMPGRIADVRLAIAQRMQSLADDSNGANERERMNQCLRRLTLLEAETWRW